MLRAYPHFIIRLRYGKVLILESTAKLSYEKTQPIL